MNLCFEVKGGAGIVDFPFQTPTSLTHAVYNESSNEKRLMLIRAYLDERQSDDKEWVEEVFAEVKALMESPNLELTYM
jgi:hypothetical protein